jgi:hypothetical protein
LFLFSKKKFFLASPVSRSLRKAALNLIKGKIDPKAGFAGDDCEASHAVNALASDLRGEHRTDSVPPEPDGFVLDDDPALGQQVLDIAQRQG